MVNFGLAREIYGTHPWFVDQETLPSFLGMFNSFRTSVHIEIPEVKYNTPSILNLSSDTKIIDRPYGNGWGPGQLDNNEDFTGVGIINIDGPITVSGGNSTVGMRSVSNLMTKMANDKRIIGFLVYADSGGGASGAVEIMVDTINEVKKTVPVIGLVKKGGIACSACYGILSACTSIYCESEMNVVGSCGTMIQFEGKAANTEDTDGFKYIRLYASKSTAKNKGYEEALNNDNYKILIEELLNPVNENFLTMLLRNRPVLENSGFDDGNTKFAKDTIGTFIDGIKSFSEVVDEITELSKVKIRNIITSKNKQTMTEQELKQQHPAVYNSIFQAGQVAERDRVGSWMAHLNADPVTVKNGISSGKEITQTEREELLIKASSLSHVSNLEKDSAPDLNTPESSNPESVEEPKNEVEAFYSKIDEKLKTE